MLARLGRFAAVFVAVVAVASITALALMTVAAAKGTGGKGFGSTTTVSIGSQASLVTGPVPGAVVTIKYSCFPSATGGKGYPGGSFASVTLGDLAGNTGFGGFVPVCDDTKQTAQVFIPGSFVAGDAAANAFVCGFECNGDSKEIKLS
jgi:hypothetical protein